MAKPDSALDSLAACPVPHHVLMVGKPDPEQARLKRDLESRGFHVSLSKDGGQAHASFVMRKPDVVVLDILLPGESGFEVCEWMKRTEPGIPVLILTELDLPEARELAEHVGADDYLIAPCDGTDLVEHMTLANQRTWEKTHLDQPKEPGRVRFQCRCGKKLKVSSTHRGKSMTCPNCGEPLIVPRHD
jgi:DNA-binding response OmpR family regulator